MATVRQEFSPDEARMLATAFPQPVNALGTNAPVPGLAYDAAATETAYWRLASFNYGSGNLTLEIIWYADTASTGVVRWDTAIFAITPNTDTQDVETKAFATTQAADTTHLGTVGQRVHAAGITISNLDAIAANDYCNVRVSRLGSHANDTMAGDAILISLRLYYSDT